MKTGTHGIPHYPHDLHRDAGRSQCDVLRAELHRAAGPDRIAASRTRDSIEQLRTRAEFFRTAMAIYRGTGLGGWYAELDRRLTQFADDLEAEARANGILGGAA